MALRKMWLRINGASRILVCDPNKDSLADVLRRIGLTGTKVGCNMGQCGACTVILNGEVVRSCVKKMKNVRDHDEILTIEGIGAPGRLHPLQQAWITYGGVQCGFCTPGFIVSSYALLARQPRPTREGVRDWFTRNNNLCRCTGYKPMVDAVMAAAAVMRGEKTMEDMTYQGPTDSIYGTKYPKPTALEKVTGLCDFGDDIGMKMPEGTLHLAIVQPEAVHARILNIDVTEAVALPGVVKVITAKDVKGNNRASFLWQHDNVSKNSDGNFKPVINDTRIFRRGDVVAVVAAVDEETARRGAALVKVELEHLPAYADALQSLAPDAKSIHEETDNLHCINRVFKGVDTREIMPKADYVVRGSFSTTRQPHMTIEPEVLQAYRDEEGRVTVHNRGQAIYKMGMLAAPAVGLAQNEIRVIQNPTGSSFGSTITVGPTALIAACTMALDKPVTLTLSYPEHMLFSGKRAASFANAALACDADGKIIGLEYDVALDTGAYAEETVHVVHKGLRFIGCPYNVPNINGMVKGVLSNNAYGIMYRSFGSPQAYMVSESLMDMMAAEIGMDPFEFRYINVARPGDTTVNSFPYREYPMAEMMDKMRPYYKEARERAKAVSTDTIKRGIGLTWAGFHVSNHNDVAEVALGLNEDGSVTHYNTWEQMGQGADIGTLTHTVEALRTLGIKPENVRLELNDTALAPNTGAAAASRSHYMAGRATIDAANKLMDAMRKPDGTFRTHEEMTAEGIPTKYFGRFVSDYRTSPIDDFTGVGDASPEANYMFMMIESDVDIVTGNVKVVAAKAIYDIGAVGNVLAVEGQAFGGLQHSIGYALTEKYSCDDKRTQNLFGAGFQKCNEMPDDLDFMSHVTPRAEGPYGSTGCAEMFQSAGHVAVLNSINNACGVRIYELPATPDKILAGLKAKEENKTLCPGPFYLGTEFYGKLDELNAMGGARAAAKEKK